MTLLLKSTYGSNTAHCIRERSQRFLLASQGATACWRIIQSNNKVKYFVFILWLFLLLLQLQ